MQVIENSSHQDEEPEDKPLDLRAGKGAGSSDGMVGLKPCLCGTPQKKTDSLQPNIRLDSYEVQGTHHPPQTQVFMAPVHKVQLPYLYRARLLNEFF